MSMQTPSSVQRKSLEQPQFQLLLLRKIRHYETSHSAD